MMRLAPAEQLHVTNRWLEVEGELRVALLRVCLIIAFYSVQLVNYLGWSSGEGAEALFHRLATYLSAVWLFASLAVVVMISRQQLPPISKYVTSAVDIILLSIMASAGSGPASPLMMTYPLIVALAGLRGSLKLIWVTTIGCVVAYLVLLFAHGQFSGAASLSVLKAVHLKPIEIMITLLAIASTGIVTGQLVRMIKQVVLEISSRQGDESQAEVRP